MEEHRLTTMVEGYDPKVFNNIYQKTRDLTYKLSYGISQKLLGVDQGEIRSWFDVKLLFVFNKYYHSKNPDVLLGFIINSLKTYKFRILRTIYTQKGEFNSKVDTVEDFSRIKEPWEVNNQFEKEDLLAKTLDLLKKKISPDAYLLLDIELYPPDYIINCMKEMGKHDLSKIPVNLICEYLSLDSSPSSYEFIRNLREEIKEAMEECRIELSKLN